MIQTLANAMAAAPAAAPQVQSPTLWGLTPSQLHDAFWSAKGVQCVRRGQRQKLQRAADLFLLIEPNQLVLMDLAQISERLTWHNAAVTRVRLIDEGERRYFEHVVTDERGLVQRIERRYRPRIQGCWRVMLTPHRRIAALWMAARARREGWDRLRRSVAWSRVDHCRCLGKSYIAGDPAQERRMLDELACIWSKPEQSISGLQEAEPGVWHVAGQAVHDGTVRVGPLWLGYGRGDDGRCLIGPAWLEDRLLQASPIARLPSLRDIIDVELADKKSIEGRQAAAPRIYPYLKRAFDIVASAVALMAMAPLMTIIAVSIVAEDGRPVLFGHRRQGRGGRAFRCWKFRTMHRDAHKMARLLEAENLCDGPQVNIRNDPRVTRIGRLLRRFDLDELPQFWNVLVGQMSLVGPRPSPDDENQFCPAWRDLRLSVRPGITGLWQLKRTREPGEDFQEWIKYDIQYVQAAGFTLDLLILLKTAHVLFLRRIRRAPDKTR